MILHSTVLHHSLNILTILDIKIGKEVNSAFIVISLNICRIVVIHITQFDEILAKISDPSFVGTLLHSASQIESTATIIKPIICQETLLSVQLVFYYPKNSFLTDVIDEKLALFKSAGLINFWSKLIGGRNPFRSHKQQKHKAKQLTFDHLRGVFIVNFFGCFLGIFSFVIEILHKYYLH